MAEVITQGLETFGTLFTGLWDIAVGNPLMSLAIAGAVIGMACGKFSDIRGTIR